MRPTDDGPECLKELFRLSTDKPTTKRTALRRYWFVVGRDPEGNFQRTQTGLKRDAQEWAEEFEKDGYSEIEVRWSYDKR